MEQPKKKLIRTPFLIALICLIGLGITAIIVGIATSGNSSTQLGDTAILTAGGDSEALLAIDKTSYDAMTKALLSKDWVGLKQFIDIGVIFTVPINTHVKIIDSDFGARKVRIIEGIYQDRSGWIAKEFLK